MILNKPHLFFGEMCYKKTKTVLNIHFEHQSINNETAKWVIKWSFKLRRIFISLIEWNLIYTHNRLLMHVKPYHKCI